jgi:hypothetical protein
MYCWVGLGNRENVLVVVDVLFDLHAVFSSQLFAVDEPFERNESVNIAFKFGTSMQNDQAKLKL